MSLRKWLLWSLALHLVAGFFSSGFHHYDEHFCIQEYTSWKLGKTPHDWLNIDYVEKTRPFFPPFVLYLIARPMQAVGIESPFVWATAFRLFSALLGWISTALMMWLGEKWITDDRRRNVYYYLNTFLWLIPYLHAHPSAESWGASFFFMGFALLYLERNPFGVGVLWGLAFQSRFQVGVMIAAMFAWMLVCDRKRCRAFVFIALGGLFTLAPCALLDDWGYGTWTFPPWHYLRWQVLEGGANSAGVTPWWDYLKITLLEGGFPMSLLFIVGSFATWITFPKHPITWATLSIVLVHTLLGHKEGRYLFPMVPALPFLLTLPMPKLKKVLDLKPAKIVVRIALAVNLVYLVVACFRPLRNEIGVYEYIYHRIEGNLYTFQNHPYHLASVAGGFYQSPKVKVVRLQTLEEGNRAWAAESQGMWIYSEGSGLPPVIESWGDRCERKYLSIPEFLFEHARPLLIKTHTRMLSLYYCRGK